MYEAEDVDDNVLAFDSGPKSKFLGTGGFNLHTGSMTPIQEETKSYISGLTGMTGATGMPARR